MDKNMVNVNDKLFKDEKDCGKVLFKNSDTKYKWPDSFINDPIMKSNDELNLYIKKISDSIVQSNALIYDESNSGFNHITVTIDFIKESTKSESESTKSESTKSESIYKPQIRHVYTHLSLHGFNDKQYTDMVSKNYYDFLVENIIYPHFGLSISCPIFPLSCIVNSELHVDANIIDKIFLKFDTNRTKIEIFFNCENIGFIDINIDNIDVIILLHIELLPLYRKKNISINVLFILMETLSAYYAPLNISLKMAYVKQMFQIAHVLQFHKAHFMASHFMEAHFMTSHWHSDRHISENTHLHSNISEKEEEYFIRPCRQ
jgi:hypothetical protein